MFEYRHADGPRFLSAIKAGDLEIVKRMVQVNPDLLFVTDDYYGSPVRAATDKHPEIADYLARVELQRLREGNVPRVWLYGAIHDLGKAAHFESGYHGCEVLRAEAEPVVAGFLAHDDPQIRRIAIDVLETHWDMKHHAHTFQAMGLDDPEEDVRQIAVSAVGFLLRDSHDRDASRFLLGIFQDPAQPAWIRETAYDGLVKIWQGFDAAHALFVRRLRREKSQRAEAEKTGAADERTQSGLQRESACDEFVDWDFMARVERVVKDKGSP